MGVLAILKGGTTSFGVFLTQELEVLAILKGGVIKGFHPLEGGGGQNVSHWFCSPPPPSRN